VRVRRRAAALLLGAAVLFLIGTNVQAGMLFVLAALFLGALLAGILLPIGALRGVEAELIAPAEATQGEPALVELRIVNRGRGVRWSLLATDEHLERASVFLPTLRPRGHVELDTLRIPARRGDVETEGVELRSSAPFGVAERRRRVTVQARTLVLPRVFPLGDLAFIEPAPTHEAGIHAAPRPGQGPDYLGVREYRPGDPMRHVHWALTARHGQIMVREFEEERTRRLLVVVDTERDEGQTWTSLDRACAAAASLVHAASAAGQGARLAAATGDGIEVVGRAPADGMLRWLARLTSSGVPVDRVMDGLDGDALRGVETAVVVRSVWEPARAAAFERALADLAIPRVVVVAVLPEGGATSPIGDVEMVAWREGEDLAAAFDATVGSLT
jgi:uncharacterized protein (DUF58 family)